MDQLDPAISVVCPTYNSARFVTRTLESVFSQTRLPGQVVVSDDGSSDDTIQTVSRLLAQHPEVKCTVIQNEHRGAGSARNAGVRSSTGMWVAFIDSDDVWLPNKLAVVSEEIRRHPEVNLLCHSEGQVSLDGTERLIDYGAWCDTNRPIPGQLYFRNFFSTSALTCRRELLLDAGLFDERIRSGVEDFDLWQRMSPGIRPRFIQEKLGYYFDRPGNLTSTSEWLKWRDMIRLALRHRRHVNSAGTFYQILRVTGFYGLRGLRRMMPAK